MSEHTTLIINWKGPYSYDDITNNPELRNGLYLAAGKQKYERGDNSIQYCGITEGNFSLRFRNHHKLPLITREQEFWLGTVAVPANASRYYLEMAEALIIYFWQPSLNEKKKISPPKSTTVINIGSQKTDSLDLTSELFIEIYQMFYHGIQNIGERVT